MKVQIALILCVEVSNTTPLTSTLGLLLNTIPRTAEAVF